MDMTEDQKTNFKDDSSGPDWIRIQSWLQNAAMELDYLVWQVIAKRAGGVPEEAPTLYKIALDLEEAPLTEEGVCHRLHELADLANGWRTNKTFPQF